MAQLTPTKLGPNSALADLVGALVAATGGGDSFLGTGKEIFVVNNASGGSVTVTFSTVVASAPDNWGVINAAHDLVQSVAAGKIAILGPVLLQRFRDANGNIQVTYSAVTSVTVGVFSVAATA